jgi:hypothetical protein
MPISRMSAWHKEQMPPCRLVDVKKNDSSIIFMDCDRRNLTSDDFTENTVVHLTSFLLIFWPD